MHFILDSLPRTLGSVGGDKDIRSAERIKSPMGDIIQDFFNHLDGAQKRLDE